MKDVTVSPLKIQSEFHHDERWGSHFDNDHGLALSLGHGKTAAVFLDRRLSSESAHEMQSALSNEGTIGHVLSCFGEHWNINVEPLKQGTFGVIIYSAKGKALLHGTGSFDESKWSAQVKTLYAGIKNARHFEVYMEVSGGSGQKTEGAGGFKDGFDF